MQNAAGAIRCPLGWAGAGVSGTCKWHQLEGFIVWGRTAPWGEEALGVGKNQPEPSTAGWQAGAGVDGMVVSRLLGGIE